MLLGILDDRSRLACHLQWYLAETAENVAHGLSQAIQKRGLPRAAMSDNGAANPTPHESRIDSGRHKKTTTHFHAADDPGRVGAITPFVPPRGGRRPRSDSVVNLSPLPCALGHRQGDRSQGCRLITRQVGKAAAVKGRLPCPASSTP